MLSDEQLNTIIRAANSCISIEAETIRQLIVSINEGFTSAVDAIFHATGRVVVTGIGKSAIVAQKIVATLNSTGTPSLFMHAADAIHGDLGMVQKNDILLCISKSGETSEIKVLIPLVKKMGSLLIAMVANIQSTLAKEADYILHTPVAKEAEPNNLAPTASTSAQMAMGDALAVALLSLRGFSNDHFAQLHPGGSLGKQLYLRLGNLITRHEVPKVLENTPIQDVIIEMTSKRLGVTAVLDENHFIRGIITDGDLRRMLQRNQWSMTTTAKDIMTSNPITAPDDMLAVEGLRLMQEKNISQLLVTKNGHYVGVAHVHDMIKEGIV